jgi:hypothetical protein
MVEHLCNLNEALASIPSMQGENKKVQGVVWHRRQTFYHLICVESTNVKFIDAGVGWRLPGAGSRVGEMLAKGYKISVRQEK